MESIADIFHIDWKILVAQTVNFTLVALILWRFIWKPVSETLDERNRKISQGLKMAEESKIQLASARETADKILLEAKVESSHIVERAAEEAKKLRAEEIKQSKTEAERIIESGKRALLSEKENIVKEIRQEAAELVMLASRSVLKEVATPEINEMLASRALKELESNK